MKPINFKLGLLLILTGMFIMSYLSCKKIFDRETLINESILRLAPRNVSNKNTSRNYFGTKRRNNNKRTEKRVPYIPPESKVTIEPKDPSKKLKDVVNIDYDIYGVMPSNAGWGLKVGMVGGGNFYAGVDKKLLFANRWGVIGGFGYRTDFGARGISPDFGVSYRIDRGVFHNTELCFEYVPLPKATGLFGVRINL